MNYDQWAQEMSKDVFLLSEEEPKVEINTFQMMDEEDLTDEES